ncbi:3-oxoadipate enol-lactonase [Novosphingobium album (ex Liu et al. 2023)]|uniref:3-oxoadipate enol-lactonase n=1 Tax=Novosphingobium album (ex Liu et al. 2023) TaxID=3031130 RepID=A0ABT5WRY8_9SPHN|nr:3-oxoadipate enol-lactonase [Novosphingobium album (ex Liu et al. 2023)]MDE8652017.1 3-oxoadipate enol-lactonase [Novosphingobium album (ex Liu et al. 2023)]
MTDRGMVTMVDGCRVAWRIDGPEDAPVLLLSNSLGTSMDMWQPQLAAFAARYRVLRYDTRGHGASDVPTGAYGLDRLGRDAIELLDGLGLARVHFCGLSLGGMTGQWLGVQAPERVERLVLANTAAFMGPPASWQARIQTVLREGMAAITGAVLERWFTPEFLSTRPQARAEVERQLLATDPAGYAGCCAAIRDMDMRPLIGLVRNPALVIGGLRDPATPPAQSAFIRQAIAGARGVDLEAAHLSNIECPGEFTEAVLGFLS